MGNLARAKFQVRQGSADEGERRKEGEKGREGGREEKQISFVKRILPHGGQLSVNTQHKSYCFLPQDQKETLFS